MGRNGFILSGGVELDFQWSCVLREGPKGPVAWDELIAGPGAGFDAFSVGVLETIDRITEFVGGIVVHRRDFAIRRWRNRVLEDPLAHPSTRLRPGLGSACQVPQL